MSACRPGAVVTVEGRRCVVLRDAVAHVLPPSDELVVLGCSDRKMVYCSLPELHRARRRHPGLPAYGFWQILLHSGMVSKDEVLQAIYIDGKDGQYLYQDAVGVAFTGEIRNGVVIANGGYALDPGAARVIGCEVRELRLPAAPALSFEERERRRAARRFRLVLCAGAAAVFLGSALIAYEAERRGAVAALEAARAALEARVETLAAGRAALREKRVSEWPDQRQALERLMNLAIALEEFTLAETPLEHSVLEVQAPDPAVLLLPAVATAVSGVRHHRDGRLTLHWSATR